MNFIVELTKRKFYSEFDSKKLLQNINETMNFSVKEIKYETAYILDKLINTDPCSYFNMSVAKQVYELLEKLKKDYRGSLEINEEIFEYYLMGYNSYSKISEIMLDLRNFNISQEIKTQLYRLPTYTSTLESCISNFLRVIVLLTGQVNNKDYTSQNTLGKLITVINSNGYDEIAKNINVNIRNAINHGKVAVKKEIGSDKLCFYYVEKSIPKCTELSFYEFDDLIDSTFDIASGVLLGITLFINENIELLKIDTSKRKYADFSLLAMKLSIPDIYCHSISDIGSNKQINIDIKIKNTDRGYIAQIATLISILVFDNYKEYDSYMISFSNPRMPTGFIRYTNKDMINMYNNIKRADNVLKDVINREDYIIFDSLEDDIDLSEVKYFCFPNYTTDKYKINSIKDASLDNRKRLKAHLFVGDIQEKKEILKIINESIEWLKHIKNPPSSMVKQKYGSMEADSLYINVYKKDTRNNKNLLPSNDNFVCFVDYNITGQTTLENGGLPISIWENLYHEVIDNVKIAWRKPEYTIRKSDKVDRNSRCLCGSGLKYKKCCGK